AIISSVTEGRINELLLVLPPTDLVLLLVALRWSQGRLWLPRWLRTYAWVRLGVVLLVLVGHATGILIQQPRVVVVLTLLSTSLLGAILQRLARSQGAGAHNVAPRSESSAGAA